MRESAVLARQHGVMLHTHLGETEDENAFCIERYGKRPLDHLEEIGWVADDVWLAHGVRFNDEEVERLGKSALEYRIARARTCSWGLAFAGSMIWRRPVRRLDSASTDPRQMTVRT